MGQGKPARQIIGFLESIATLTRLRVKYTRRATLKLGRLRWLKSVSRKRFLASHENFGEESFGDGGIWRRGILMGDKCQPLDFSGVIYYDCDGRRVYEPPVKSPRGSPFVRYAYPTAQN